MRRLNLNFFMRLGAQLSAMSDWTSPERASVKADASQLRDSLNMLFSYNENPMQLPASFTQARTTIEKLDKIVSAPDDAETKARAWETWIDVNKLDTLLQGEMAVQAVYHIWPKRAYDTNRLVNDASTVFSNAVSMSLSEIERYDVDQAGKCLGFETATAAAFHLLRLTESAIRRYYGVVVGTIPKPKMRNWGAYIAGLKRCGASDKVLFAISEIKDIYRNPVLHPEEQLSMDEALSLLGIVETTISLIYTDMFHRQAQQISLPLAVPSATS